MLQTASCASCSVFPPTSCRLLPENISSFTCRLHPEMADLSKDIYFTVNGKEYRVTPEADTTHPDYTAKVQLVLN